MDGILESSNFAATSELPATVVGTVLIVATLLGSTPVGFEVTMDPETNSC